MRLIDTARPGIKEHSDRKTAIPGFKERLILCKLLAAGAQSPCPTPERPQAASLQENLPCPPGSPPLRVGAFSAISSTRPRNVGYQQPAQYEPKENSHQASPVGCDGFPGYGRAATDTAGWFRFVTVKPAARQADQTTHAPHCGLGIMARGLLRPQFTRLYFDDETANATDPVLALIEPAGRRETLIARRVGEGAYRLDINLQGPQETVFLEF